MARGRSTCPRGDSSMWDSSAAPLPASARKSRPPAGPKMPRRGRTRVMKSSWPSKMGGNSRFSGGIDAASLICVGRVYRAARLPRFVDHLEAMAGLHARCGVEPPGGLAAGRGEPGDWDALERAGPPPVKRWRAIRRSAGRTQRSRGRLPRRGPPRPGRRPARSTGPPRNHQGRGRLRDRAR